MVKKIVAGYGSLFNAFSKMAALVVVCAAIGAAFVIPLWKFATEMPKAYTIVVMVLMIAAAIFLCAKKIIDIGIKPVASWLAKFVIIAGGIVLCIKFVLDGNRILTLPTILAIIALYGIISFGFKNGKKKVES